MDGVERRDGGYRNRRDFPWVRAKSADDGGGDPGGARARARLPRALAFRNDFPAFIRSNFKNGAVMKLDAKAGEKASLGRIVEGFDREDMPSRRKQPGKIKLA